MAHHADFHSGGLSVCAFTDVIPKLGADGFSPKPVFKYGCHWGMARFSIPLLGLRRFARGFNVRFRVDVEDKERIF